MPNVVKLCKPVLNLITAWLPNRDSEDYDKMPWDERQLSESINGGSEHQLAETHNFINLSWGTRGKVPGFSL